MSRISSVAAAICLFVIVSITTAQNTETLCRQVYSNCQACSVFESECRRPQRPTNPPTQRPQPQRPTQSPSQAPWPPQTPAPTWPPQQSQHNPDSNFPDSPNTDPQGVPPQPALPPHNCVKYGKWCQSDNECCTKNCKLELVTLGGPDHHYTQSVCR